MTTEAYSEPVAALLTLGRPDRGKEADFQDYGITQEHVSELIHLMLDEDLRAMPWVNDEPPPDVYGGIYAWRVLGWLGAAEAIPYLLEILHFIDDDNDDWVGEEAPLVLASFGAPAVEPCRTYLLDVTHGLWARVAAARALSEIGKAHPDQRAACVEALVECLKSYQENDETLNAFLVSGLVDLQAVEILPLIRKAFAADAVDLMVMGDIEDVEIELGVLDEQRMPHPSFWGFTTSRSAPEPVAPPEKTAVQASAGKGLAAPKKKRRKMAKQTRRKNRKKKRK